MSHVGAYSMREHVHAKIGRGITLAGSNRVAVVRHAMTKSNSSPCETGQDRGCRWTCALRC